MGERTITVKDFDKAIPEICADLTMHGISEGKLSGVKGAEMGTLCLLFGALIRKKLFPDAGRVNKEDL